MSWQPVILGVNGSEESVRAACAGAIFSRRAGVECVPVFAAPDYAHLLGSYGMANPSWLLDDTLEEDRRAILASLRGRVPEETLADLVLRTGRASQVLKCVARERGAGLIAVGSRPRRGLDRVGHDTVRHLLRTSDYPLLVAGAGGPTIRRIIAAVDVSHAARPTLETAIRWAELFAAELRVVHAVEPLPGWARPRSVRQAEPESCEERLLEIGVHALASRVGAECVVRHGHAAQVLRREVSRWKADLLVVGSHGRGFVDRLLLGSTAERLLRRTPSQLLVIPTGSPAADRPLDVEALPWEEGAEAAVARN